MTSNLLSRQIRTAREAAGLSQAELAKRLGTRQSVISLWENDNYLKHTTTTLARLSAVLGCNLSVSLEKTELSPCAKDSFVESFKSAAFYDLICINNVQHPIPPNYKVIC